MFEKIIRPLIWSQTVIDLLIVIRCLRLRGKILVGEPVGDVTRYVKIGSITLKITQIQKLKMHFFQHIYIYKTITFLKLCYKIVT